MIEHVVFLFHIKNRSSNISLQEEFKFYQLVYCCN